MSVGTPVTISRAKRALDTPSNTRPASASSGVLDHLARIQPPRVETIAAAVIARKTTVRGRAHPHPGTPSHGLETRSHLIGASIATPIMAVNMMIFFMVFSFVGYGNRRVRTDE